MRRRKFDTLSAHFLPRFLVRVPTSNEPPAGLNWPMLPLLFLPSAVPFVAAWLDDTLFLPGDGRGLLEHYGGISQYVLAPICFLFFIKAIRLFDEFVFRFDSVIHKEKFAEVTSPEALLERFYHRDPFVWIKYLFLLAGVAFFALQARLTLPDMVTEYYGHDTYDSANHIPGYISHRFFALVWGVYLLPITVYRVIVLIIVVSQLFRVARKTDALHVRPLHHDKAGGFGRLGRAALYLNTAVLVSMLIPIALFFTHGSTTVLVVEIVAFMALFLIVFFLPLWSPHLAMRAWKEKRALEVSDIYNQVSQTVITRLQKSTSPEDYSPQEVDVLSKLEQMSSSVYGWVERAPTWPIGSVTRFRFGINVFVGIGLALVEFLRNWLMDGGRGVFS